MSTFILRRLVLAIPVLIGILAVTFILGHLIPGDPCRAMLGEKATAATCDAYIERFGLNQPITVQFGIYMGNFLRGDLGTSVRFGQPVTALLVERHPTTTELAFTAL